MSVKLHFINKHSALKGNHCMPRLAGLVFDSPHTSRGIVLRIHAAVKGRKSITADFLLCERNKRKRPKYDNPETIIADLEVTHLRTIEKEGNLTPADEKLVAGDIEQVLSDGKKVSINHILTLLEFNSFQINKIRNRELVAI